jgi:hypothetical protein
MNNLRLPLTLILTAMFLAPALAQAPHEPGVMQYFDFENGTAPWVSMNPQAVVGLTAKQENVFAGTSSLEVQYFFDPTKTGEAGMTGNIILPLEGGIPGLKAVSLAFKCSESIMALVGGREQDGSTYMAPFFATAGVWQKVTLGLDDFNQVDEETHPGGKFDPGELEGLGVIDASSFLAAITAKLPVTQYTAGERTFWLDEVKLLATDLPAETVPLPAGSPEAVVIDSCDRAAIRWIVLGGKDWKAKREVDVGATSGDYRFDYTAPAGTLVAWMKPIHRGRLAGTKMLHLSVCALDSFPLIVTVEGKGKARYSTPVKLVAGDGLKRFDLAWGDFALDKDAPAGAGPLEPAEITSLTLADVSALGAQTTGGKRCLWVQGVYATK